MKARPIGRRVSGVRLMFACVLALLAHNVAMAQSAMDRIKQRSTVVIGHRASSVPLSYVVDGQPVGYSVELCQRIAAAIGRELGIKEKDLKIAYKEVTSANRFQVIQNGEADLECGSTTNTAERRKLVAFSIPHFIAASRMLVRANQSVNRLEDLDGKRVTSTDGTTVIDVLRQAALSKGLKLDIQPVKEHSDGVQAVLSGRADAFVMDDVLLFGLRASIPKPEALKVVGKPLTVEPYAVAFQRDDSRLKRVADAEIRHLMRSGEMRRMYDRWFTEPIPPKNVNLAMPMSSVLSDHLRFPSDFVPDL